MHVWQGKRVLVTGAGTGIGKGIAARFAEAGAAVVFHYAHSASGAQAEVARVTGAGGRAKALGADFTSVAEVQRLATEALAFLGGLDVLVNNAGITLNLPFEKVTPEQFDTLYHVNVRAGYFLTQALVGALAASRGVVINISSIHAFEGMQEHSVYAGTRAAVVGFTRELAVELAPRGIRVVGIAPGAVAVENQYKAIPNFDPEANGRFIPAGFVGTPRDIAEVALFLAGPGARYVVGQTLIVDGGTTSWMPFGEGFREPLNCRFGQGYVPGI
jgi:NAD(P)-dependent dehydrogenase (short-subunit alcohol dehydrogenase family)